MKKIALALSIIVAPIILSANNFITKVSSFSVDETISNIEKIVKSKEGMGVFIIIDHKEAAKKAGMDIANKKVILFGSPKLDTRLMMRDPKIALDFPLKVLVYKDYDGKTWIVYRNPIKWKKDFDLEGCGLMSKMVNVLDQITTKASK